MHSAVALPGLCAGLTTRPCILPPETCIQSRRRHQLHASAPALTVVDTTQAKMTGNYQTYITPEARKALFGPAQQVDEKEGAVVGNIPSWLCGSLVLNGGADYTGMVHMFDGYGMLSKIRIAPDGKVYGSQKFIQTQAYKHFSSTGKMKWREFGTPVPTNSAVGRVANIAGTLVADLSGGQSYTDNASVNVIPLSDGSVMALSEVIYATYRLEPSTLSTLHQVIFTDGVPGNNTTAHPKLMPDGTLVNLVRKLPVGNFHVYKQDPRTLERTQIAEFKPFKLAEPSWIHDISMSQNYVIICETPFYLNMGSMLLGYEAQNVVLDWKPEDGTRVHVVALDGSGVRTYQAPAFIGLHYANAFESEDGKFLHVDMVAYDDGQIIDALRLDHMLEYPGRDLVRSHLKRLTIPLDVAHTSATRLEEPRLLLKDESVNGNFVEFPCISPANRGKMYKYVYTTAAIQPTNLGNALAKHDVEEGTSVLWHEEGGMPAEPTFVPAPNPHSEDDGVVLSMVMGANGKSFLVVLDGRTFQEVARAQLPYAIPYRFHGTFLPGV